jgi:peptide/nickel transport system substrate-binding protein
MNFLLYTTTSQLTEVSSSGKLVPLLADNWEGSSGATQWTFQLKKGVEFHNGKPLTADDVIASIARHAGPNSHSTLKVFADQIVEMKKDGDYTVTFRLTQGNADFPVILSASRFGILPSKDGKVDLSGVGSGAYALEEINLGQNAKLKRNPNYFMPDRAWFDSAEIVVIADSTARQNALATGAVQFIDSVPPQTAHLLEGTPNVKIIDVPGYQHYNFPMRTDMPPFNDNNVRMALKLAMNREEILAKVLQNHGTLGNDHPIARSMEYYDNELSQRSYDPDKAKFYLNKAGLQNLKLEIAAANGIWAGAVDACVLYSAQAAKAGITITPKTVPDDGFWDNVWMKVPWCTATWSGRPTADWMFSEAYAAGATWNDTYWRNDRFNELLKAARAELDSGKRRSMYFEMQSIVRDDGGALIPLFANYVMGHSDKLAHPDVVAGNWEFDGYKLLERWWYA